jgi:serine/threonine protein phosphatase PrpC
MVIHPMWKNNKTDLNTPSLNVSAVSHAGYVRDKIEDRYIVKKFKDLSVLCAVADGLGDEGTGVYAAEIIRERLEHANLTDCLNPPGHLEHMALELDRDIYNKGQLDHYLDGMGSTLIGVLVQDRFAYWVHVGDSRLYLLRNQELIQVTQDQTLARFLLQEGEITEKQASSHYSRHVMDQYLGCGYSEPEKGFIELKPKDMIIIASDGLHQSMDTKVISSVLLQPGGIENRVKSLLQAALNAGGQDNITIVGIDIMA